MIELLEITKLFLIFSLLLISPFNFYKKEILGINFDQSSLIALNLIFNLNILLFFSLIPLKLSDYSIFFILYLLIFFIKNYFFERNILKFNNENYLTIFIFFIIFFILSIDIANKLNLGWDAKWFWLIKSLYYSQDNTFKELTEYIYNDYHPHLGSYIWAFFSNLTILNFEYFGRIFYLFLFIFVLFFITKKIFQNDYKSSLISTILIIILYKYKYFSGLQEILIFSILIIISKLIYDYILNRNLKELFIIFLSLNLILWIKAEGIAYFFIVVICINFIKKLNLNHRIVFNAACFFIIIFKILIYNFFEINLNNQPYYLDYLKNLNFEILINQFFNILIYLFYYSFDNIIFFISFIILLLLNKNILQNEYYKNISMCFVLNICFIFSAYIFRDMELVHSIRTTMDRIVFSSSGFYLFFIILYIKKLSSRFIN